MALREAKWEDLSPSSETQVVRALLAQSFLKLSARRKRGPLQRPDDPRPRGRVPAHEPLAPQRPVLREENASRA